MSSIQMSLSLEDLGYHELAHVLFYVNGHSIITLYCTGNAGLRLKMARSAVTEVILQYTSQFLEARIPSCLSDFQQLRRLSIYISSPLLSDSDSIRRVLKRLHPSLESLELDFPGADVALLDHVPVTSYWLFDEDNSCQSVATCSEEDHMRLWNMKSRFPRLNSLRLETRTLQLMNCDMLHLPPTLTHLSLPSPHEITLKGLSLLPKGLLELHTGMNIELPLNVPLPPALLVLTDLLSFKDQGASLSTLPPTIESIRVEKETRFEFLPPGLHTLFYFASLPEACNAQWSLLPNLTHLDIRMINIPIKNDFLPSLPQTLKTLHLASSVIDISNMSAEKACPPKLTRLTINSMATIDSSTFAILPPSLEFLSIKATKSLGAISDWPSLLPRSLRKFEISTESLYGPLVNWPPFLSQCIILTYGSARLLHEQSGLEFSQSRFVPRDFNSTVSSSTVPHIPLVGANLFKCSYPTLLRLRLDVRNGITSETIAKLPASLRSLELPFCVSVTSACFPMLPPLLESLEMGAMFGRIEDPDHLARLPATLTSLVLMRTPFFHGQDDEDQTISEEAQELAIKMIRALPRQLLSFEHLLSFATPTIHPKYMKKLFKALPRTLTSLETPYWEIHSNQFIDLPRPIRSLSATPSQSFYTASTEDIIKIVPDVPNRLENIRLDNGIKDIGPTVSAIILRTAYNRQTPKI